MPDRSAVPVAIVDYGLGNLFSVKHACEGAGLHANITSSKQDIQAASAVILPGVGAFGVAMENLQRLDLLSPLRDVAASRIPLIGICLGMQLLMTESQEFGRHQGLGVIEGEVVRLRDSEAADRRLKVPQVGWNRIWTASNQCSWSDTLLGGVRNGEYMYFVHSFYCQPGESGAVLSMSRYGELEFCSAVCRGNAVGVQFHPERSGPQGLQIYRNLAAWIKRAGRETQSVREVGSQVRFA